MVEVDVVDRVNRHVAVIAPSVVAGAEVFEVRRLARFEDRVSLERIRQIVVEPVRIVGAGIWVAPNRE